MVLKKMSTKIRPGFYTAHLLIDLCATDVQTLTEPGDMILDSSTIKVFAEDNSNLAKNKKNESVSC